MYIKIAQAVAEAWNAQHPSGTPVLYIDDHGNQVWTTTRSEAWAVGGDDHATPIVKLQIGRGGYDLTRVIVHRGQSGQSGGDLPEIGHDEESGLANCGDVFAKIVRAADGQSLYDEVRLASYHPPLTAEKFRRIAGIVAEALTAKTTERDSNELR